MIKIKKQIFFDERGIFGYIDLAPKKPLSYEELKTKIYKLEDVFGKQYNCYLKTVFRFQNTFPDVITFHAEGLPPELAKKRLIERGIDIKKPLAYYIFKKK